MTSAACAVLLFASTSAHAASKTIDIQTVDGLRHAIVDTLDGSARPTLIVLHGAMVGAALTERTSRFREAAFSHGYAAVFPDGIGRVWNDGRAFRAGANDVAFLKILAHKLVLDGVADPKRLYIAGISNGGMMTMRMLCEAPDDFAGAATVIAAMGEDIGEHCKPQRVMPLVMISGTADSIVPYTGGKIGLIGARGAVWGAERTAALFAKANGCNAPKETKQKDGASTETSVTRFDWACDPRNTVTLFRVENGGHQAYGGASLPQFMFGKTTVQFSAPEAIIEAFDAAAKAGK